MSNNAISRRRFLGQASCAAVGSAAAMSTAVNLGMFNSLASSPGGGYRALVCLFLAGGNDSFNMLIPRSQADYDEYAAIRGDLAIPQAQLLPITPATSDGRQYGLHPSMPEVQQLFAAGKLSLVTNVGTLVEPTTLAAYQAGTASIPVGLFSHNDQIMHWQSSLPDRRSAVGWAGRMADILEAGNNNENISMNISLSGSNIFQSGQSTVHYSIGPDGSTGLTHYGETWQDAALRTQAIDSQLDQSYANIFEQAYADKKRASIDAHLDFRAAIDSIAPLQTTFGASGLSQSFEMIAQTIAARNALGMARQTFFVQFGGWDHHDEVLNNQLGMLAVVSQALGEFNTAMEELGVQDDVLTYSASDFGRTLTSNGAGSDHGWGGNQIVMGGGINGGDLFGTFPSLYEGAPLDTGRGRLIPTTSVDEYFGDLACWMGVSTGDLPLVLPNLDRFYTIGSGSPPVGFVSV